MNYYFLGWMDNDLPPHLGESLYKNLQNKNRIVYISGDPTNPLENGQDEIQWLTNIGIIFSHSFFIDIHTPIQQAQKEISEADVIFLLGGYPLQQLQLIQQKQLYSLLKKSEAIIIGASAGAINMGNAYPCNEQFGFEVSSPFISKGLELQPFVSLSHFNLTNECSICNDPLINKLVQNQPVYIFNKHCGIHVTDKTIEFFGEIYQIVNGRFHTL